MAKLGYSPKYFSLRVSSYGLRFEDVQRLIDAGMREDFPVDEVMKRIQGRG